MMGIGTRIKNLRKQVKLTQPELAERIGVHETTIRRWEQERDRGPDGKAVTLLAEVLKTTPEYLLNDSSDENISLSYTNEHSNNRGMAIFTSRNGERFEVPATPEGYAFLRDMAARIANREVAPAMA